MNWLIGYLNIRHGRSWYKFLSSLPNLTKVRFIIQSLFLPLLILLFVSLILRTLSVIVIMALILLGVFIDTARDFFNLKHLHKTAVLTFLALINRSIRTIGAIIYIAANLTKHSKLATRE